MRADLVIRNASQVVTCLGDPGVIEGGAVAVRDGKVVGVDRELEVEGEVLDARGGVVTPGFVDPHTHVVFAGSRPREFEWRLEGRPYLEILGEGGGILATVRAVREADGDRLVAESLPRILRMLSFGVTTVEVKSGYGLDVEAELKILRAIRTLGELVPVRLVPTFLGAHAFPPEYGDDHEGYVELVIREMIPRVVEEGLARGCDVYVDRGVFDADQAERILRAGKDAGLGVHVHAGQFEDRGGPEMAAGLGALSVDHLDVISDRGLEMMAEAGSVAVMLPGASVSLGQEPPRVERIQEAGVTVALATDCNPGTSYTENLPLMAFEGCTRMGLSVSDAMLGITRNAARAIGVQGGTIEEGARADLVIHGVGDWREILYHFGVTHVRDVLVAGRSVL
jgi:imidazolonepropionase